MFITSTIQGLERDVGEIKFKDKFNGRVVEQSWSRQSSLSDVPADSGLHFEATRPSSICGCSCVCASTYLYMLFVKTISNKKIIILMIIVTL